MDPGLVALVALYSASILLLMYLLRGAKGSGSRERVVVRLRCVSCDRSVFKRFEEGDYVGRRYDDLCGECGAAIVESIYVEEVEGLARRLFPVRGRRRADRKK